MADPYDDHPSTPGSPGRVAQDVTPSGADVDIDPVAKGVVVTVAGNLSYVPAGNSTSVPVTVTDAPVGFIPPHRVKQIKNTGTTAEVWTIED